VTDNFERLTPEEAAALIQHGDTIAFGGFTTAGNPRTIAAAIADKATEERRQGREFRIGDIGVATASMDELLAEAIQFRTPYQSNPKLRSRVNELDCEFFDMHLSQLTQALRYGSLPTPEWAIVQAAAIKPDGTLLLTSAVGGSPTFCHKAKRIIVELNHSHPPALEGIHDIYEPADPPDRREIPVYSVSDRIGTPWLAVDPAKIAGVVECSLPDEGTAFAPVTPVTERIGANVAEFLAAELATGRLPKSFLPLQSGVGNTANSVLGALGRHPGIPPFAMYTEIIQDSVLELMDRGRITFASCCGVTLSTEGLAHLYADLDAFKRRMVLRPQEISNHPEVVRRLGIISMNTALEADVFGNVNSTHVRGSHMMNGMGGSGDFTRNAYLSIFTTASTAKDGRISAIVPMVTHVDHSEHSVQVLATEWGVADLRGKSPRARARMVIDTCAHPDYRDQLHEYVSLAEKGHTACTLKAAFSFHERFESTGDMRSIAKTRTEGPTASGACPSQ
jgi:acetyl-CoA hydrolase